MSTFGRTAVGTSGAQVADRIAGSIFQCTEQGQALSITARLVTWNNPSTVRAALYRVDPTKYTLVGYTEQLTVLTPDAYMDFVFNFINGGGVENARYLIVVWGSPPCVINSEWRGVGFNVLQLLLPYTGVFPSEIALADVTVDQADHEACIYVTYTPGAIPPPPQQLALTVSPSSASLQVGQTQIFTAYPVGGVTPYTIQWIDDAANLLGTGIFYVFNAVQVGSFRLRAQVTDSQYVSANSPIIDITVSGLPPPPPPPVGIPYAVGNRIFDANGNLLKLKGPNYTHYLNSSEGWWQRASDYNTYGVWDEANVRLHLNTMKSWGINSIRITYRIDWWINNTRITSDGKASNMAFRDSLFRTIQIAKELGMYVILCVWSVSGAQAMLPYPIPGYNVPGADPSVIPDVAAWINFMLDVSRQTRQYDNVILELHNEPDSWNLPQWFDPATQCINALRADNEQRLLVMHFQYSSGFMYMNWINTWVQQGRPTANIVFSSHIYRDQTIGSSNPVTVDSIRNILTTRGYLHVLNDLNLPVWVGEIGCDLVASDLTNEYEYFRNTLQVLNEMGAGWSVWEWHAAWGAFASRRWGIYDGIQWVEGQAPPPSISGEIVKLAIGEVPPTGQGTLTVRTTPSVAPITVGGVAETTPFGPTAFTVGQVPIVFGDIQGYYTPQPVTAQIVEAMNTLIEQTYTPIPPPPPTYDLTVTVIRNMQPINGATVKLVAGPTTAPDQVTDMNGRTIFMGLSEGNYRFDAYYIPELGVPEYGTVTVDPSLTSSTEILVLSVPTPKPNTLPLLLGAGLVLGSVIYVGTRKKER